MESPILHAHDIEPSDGASHTSYLWPNLDAPIPKQTGIEEHQPQNFCEFTSSERLQTIAVQEE